MGVDATGRFREGNQLPTLPLRLSEENPIGQPTVETYQSIPVDKTLEYATNFLFRRNGRGSKMPLSQFIETANTRKTPARDSYADGGMFILKVGNLSGREIDWSPRDRNFVSPHESAKRSRDGKLILHEGDILMTSSAHAVRYIAKKVDLVSNVPERYQIDGITFVGEVMRVRPAEGVDPFILLAALRHSQFAMIFSRQYVAKLPTSTRVIY